MSTESPLLENVLNENGYTVSKTKIGGLLVVERKAAADERGFFREVYRKSLFQNLSVEFDNVQVNHSCSITGVIRGIHAERWDKFVYPLTGRMMAAIVDLREDSPTFAKVEYFYFDCVNALPSKALFLPKGMGNSICAVEGPVNYVYFVSDYWTKDSSFAINPFDEELNIQWPVENPILTTNDRTAPMMRTRFPNKY